MAIVQISRITHRKGLQENLPQLAGAELGWSVDTRRLYIGNGTLEEGAPVIGNTEILTEFSDILAFQTTYTYKGEAAGYTVQTGPTANDPVSQSLQSWLDQFATVKDFGAVGDGITDDTAAINRALYQLYCREVNPQIRRSLFFPAGVYRTTQTIVIPPFATLIGEGPDNSIIQLDAGDDSALRAYVARTGDSLQQTGVNIGNNGAIVPQYVTVQNLGFASLDQDVGIFLVEDADNCSFQSVTFQGALTTANLNTSAAGTAGVTFASTPSLVAKNIVFDRCLFSGTTYGALADVAVTQINFINSKFDTLYQGVVLGPTNPGVTAVKVLHSLFDNIYAQGVLIDSNATLCATGYNYFMDVGNGFNGITNPISPIVDIHSANNVSVADMFERTDQYSTVYRRVELNYTPSIATINGSATLQGTYVRATGQRSTLVNNTSVPTTVTTENLPACVFNYTIRRGATYRTGALTIVDGGLGSSWSDDYVENVPTGVTLSVTVSGGVATILYTTTNTGVDGFISYSITRFS